MKKYRSTIILVIVTYLSVPCVDELLFTKFSRVNYFNLVLESILSIFVLFPLFAIQNFKKNKFYWNLNIGFYLLLVSYYVDAVDQIYMHSVLFTVLFEKITLVAAALFIFIGSKQWMKSFVRLSLTDDLTQIPNRRLINKLIEKEIVYCKKTKCKFSLAIIDIDHFKNINDEFGHNIGDKVLKLFAQYLTQSASNEYVVGRWGGEEFIIILNETNSKQALNKMDELRSKISKHRFMVKDIDIQFSVSIGITQWQDDEDNLEDLFIQADKALYIAKNSGRNKVETYQNIS